MPQPLLTQDIRQAIASRRWRSLSDRQTVWSEPDIVGPDLADLMSELGPEDLSACFQALPHNLALSVFTHLVDHPAARTTLLATLSQRDMRQLLSELSPDDRTAFLGHLPGQLTQGLLNLLDSNELEETRLLLGYPVNSVGRIMTPDYVAVRPDWQVSQALEHIRARGENNESLDVIYVCDETWHLLDALPLRIFILAPPDVSVREAMDSSFIELSPFDDREAALRLFERYDVVALPVVDSEGVLLGVVTVDDILDVAEKEFTEDFQRFAAIEPIETSYWQTSVGQFYRSRVVWLGALVLFSLLSSGVIAAFEETLSSLVVLSFFIPLLMGAGGNTGSQSATIIIRALSAGNIKLTQWWPVVRREALTGLALGLSLGLLGFVLGTVQAGGASGDGLKVGFVIFLTMTLLLCVTNLLGATLPFVMTRLKLDPASASGPVVASISDTIGLLIYFSLARFVLNL